MIHTGSLESDASRKIAKIEYDNLNNPVRIQFTNGIDKYQFDEGYCQASAAGSVDYFDSYYYDRDHLGNVRRVIEPYGTNKSYVIQRMNYYPFGAEFCDNSTKNFVQNHKYNGKEFDHMHGLNTYDYGARQYNPVTGRWDRIDSLCEKYYSTSPYVYCENNPVMLVDPDGRIPYKKAVKSGIVTSKFDPKRFHPVKKKIRPHKGVDLRAAIGTEVHVLADGVVSRVTVERSRKTGEIKGYGQYVEVTHANGYKTKYAHLTLGGVKVQVGDNAKNNDVIALSGNTGIGTAPHLHVEIIKNGIHIDPASVSDLQNEVSNGNSETQEPETPIQSPDAIIGENNDPNYPNQLPEVVVRAQNPSEDFNIQ